MRWFSGLTGVVVKMHRDLHAEQFRKILSQSSDRPVYLRYEQSGVRNSELCLLVCRIRIANCGRFTPLCSKMV